jgi:hypothetical protein
LVSLIFAFFEAAFAMTIYFYNLIMCQSAAPHNVHRFIKYMCIRSTNQSIT